MLHHDLLVRSLQSVRYALRGFGGRTAFGGGGGGVRPFEMGLPSGRF